MRVCRRKPFATGFEPQRTQSMHWFSDRRFQTAIGDLSVSVRWRGAIDLMQAQTAFAI
jgi:predicted N-acyltransferase